MTQEEITKRLQEIAETSLQNLEDEAILGLLSERKTLLIEATRLEEEAKKQKEEAERLEKEKEKKEEEKQKKELQEKNQNLTARLAEVNKSITPDQDDDQLLALIQERKVLEAELRVLRAESPLPEEDQTATTPVLKEEAAPPQGTVTEESILEQKADADAASLAAKPESKEEEPETKITINTNAEYNSTNYVSPSGKVSEIDTTEDRVALDSSLQSGEFQGYLSELKGNLNSLGTFLQGLPLSVKRNRAFMLEVAKVDPAYAMHYADKDTLKRDETFNVAIAGMNNQRNTGNPLSEMLPEMRTGSVLLAGVKNDFKNIRFIRPEMPEYEEILTLAQKGALEAVASLKNAHDVQFLLPPILQKDKAFMKEVEKLTNQT